MPPKRGARSASRKDSPSSPPKPRDNAVLDRQMRGTARTRQREAQTASPQQQRKTASVTIEENDAADASAKRQHDTEERDSSPDPPEDGSEQGSEILGGTSFSSSGSDDFNALDADDIIADLSAIDDDSRRVLNLFKTHNLAQLSQDVRKVNSPAAKRVLNYSDRLRQSTRSCSPRQLINIDMIVRKLLKLERHDDLPLVTRRPRPGPILAKANLALFLSRLVSLSLQQESTEILETLFYVVSVDAFPDPFGFGSTSSELPATTSDVALNILTQCYIAGAHARSADKAYDPTDSLTELFETTSEELSVLKNNLDQEALELRQSEIRKHSGHRKQKVDLSKLRRHFPWESFLKQVVSWALQITVRLDEEIESQDGAEAISDRLVSHTYDSTGSPEKSRSEKRKSRTSDELRRKYEGMKHHFKEAEQANADDADQEPSDAAEDGVEIQETVPSPSRRRDQQAEARESSNVLTPSRGVRGLSHRPLAEVPQDDVPNVSNDEQERTDGRDEPLRELSVEEEQESLIPTQATAHILSVEARQEQESNKENIPQKKSLLDRQEGAVREEWDSSGPSSNAKGKRRRDEADDEDDFEDDTRQEPVKRSKHRPENTNSALFVPEDTSELASSIPQTVSSQPARSRPLVRPNMSPPPSTAAAALPYAEVKALAQTNTTYLKSVAPLPAYMAPSQSRRAWTSAEVTRLLEMIEKHGCKWSLILKEDSYLANPELQGRNQVQLKDKARNIKLDYLKAEMRLPKNFAGVTISKSHKEELDRLGVHRGRDARFEDDFALED